MHRMAITLMVAGLTGAVLSGQGAGTPSLDVVGIRLGMTTKEAAAALRADNPRLMLAPTTQPLEGFAQPLLLSIIGNEGATTGPTGEVARAAENIELLFTTPPSPETVWAVKRVYSFATKERPDLQATIDALRKKYGPESIAPSPDVRDQSKFMAWVYDAQGKSMGPGGAQLNMTCAGLVSSHFGGDGNTMNEIQSGQPGPAPCQSVIIVNANILATRLDPGNPQFVVYSLIVQITDGARHRASVDATRAVAVAATKARQQREADEVKKRAAPKL